MHKIQVGFSRPKGFFHPVSWAIMLRINRNYSHCYLVVDSIVYEAIGKGVSKTSHENLLEDSKEVALFEIEVSEDRKHQIVNFLESQLGKKYGVGQLFKILFGIKKDNGRSQFICSELVADALRPEFLITYDKLDRIDPQDIYEMIENDRTNWLQLK